VLFVNLAHLFMVDNIVEFGCDIIYVSVIFVLTDNYE